MTVNSLFQDMMLLCVFFIAGYVIRECCPLFRKLYLPSAVVGGGLALLAGDQMLGVIVIPKSFSSLSEVLIAPVICALVFGVTINRRKPTSFLDHSTMCLGLKGAQLGIGVLFGIVFAAIWPNLPVGWATMGMFAFHGGHGHSATAGSVYSEMGFTETIGVGMIFATIGLLGAVVVGMTIVNIGIRKGWTRYLDPNRTGSGTGKSIALVPEQKRRPIGMSRVYSASANNLAFQFALLMVAMYFGSSLFVVLGDHVHPFFHTLPSMMKGVVGGVLLWLAMCWLKLDGYVDKATINTISGFILEIIIVSAIATLRLDLFTTHLMPLLLYSLLLIIVSVVLCLAYARKCCRDEWFEKAVMCFGAGTGNTATGLALVRAVDPDGQSSAPDAHAAYVSSLGLPTNFFPVLVPMLFIQNPWSTVLLGLGIMAVSLGLGVIVFRK